MSRSAVARHVRRALIVLTVALLAAFVYHAFRSYGTAHSPLATVWILALSFLLNGLYSLVFAPEAVAITQDRYRRYRWVRAFNLGAEPSEQSIRWSGVAQVVMGVIMLASWWAFERPS